MGEKKINFWKIIKGIKRQSCLLYTSCRFAIFNHFTAEPVRITMFLNDFLSVQFIVKLCYSLFSRFNRSINIRNMLLEIFISFLSFL